jgi:hypothetical protein
MEQIDDEMKIGGMEGNDPEVMQRGAQDQPAGQQPKEASTFEQIKMQVSEDDDIPVGPKKFLKLVFGEFLTTQFVRRQIWLLLLIVLFITVSVAFRYQCQQDEIKIAKMEKELVDIKYRALASSSKLTESCRESRVLEALQKNHDSILHISTVPPYIINIEEK